MTGEYGIPDDDNPELAAEDFVRARPFKEVFPEQYMTANRKALDRWARDFGYADFDTYIRTGGSILDARREIADRISSLERALRALDGHTASERHPAQTQMAAAQAQLSAADLTDTGSGYDPPDPDNAHPQGDDA